MSLNEKNNDSVLFCKIIFVTFYIVLYHGLVYNDTGVFLYVPQGYSRELFQFEEDRFENVPSLIRFYVGGRRPISKASGAIIFQPITRTLPLRAIAERHAELKSGGVRSVEREKLSRNSKRRSFSSTHNDTLQVINPLLRLEQVWQGVHTVTLKKLLLLLCQQKKNHLH